MDPLPALLVLAFVLLVHLTFVNINIGLGFLSVAARWRSKSDPKAEELSKHSVKFVAANEVVSGVYGTLITVILFGFWTGFVNVVVQVLFFALLISVIAIIIRLTSIAAYWYTWGRIGVNAHLIIGLIMAISGLFIPAGFRYIFAFMNNPAGLMRISPLEGDVAAALSNPLYPPLLLHTWVGALSIGFLAAATGFAWASKRSEYLRGWAAKTALVGALLIIPQGIVGFWYWSSLSSHSPILFNALNIGLISGVSAQTNVSHSFLAMVLIGLYLLTAGLIYYAEPSRIRLAYTLAPLSILSLYFGEITQNWGRMPYLILQGDTGLDVNLFVNKLVYIDAATIMIAIAPIAVITIGFVALLYHYLVKGFMES
ncbi:MAG: cytochrome ubiquinol oxidase subunit I [Nitrososphaerales archaeon]